jgi:hypothetical protein
MYDLELKLPCILERHHLPIPGKALSTDSFQEGSAMSILPYERISHLKIHAVASRSRTKGALWTRKEDATSRKMKERGCPWGKTSIAPLLAEVKGRFRCAIISNSKYSAAESDWANHKYPSISWIKTRRTLFVRYTRSSRTDERHSAIEATLSGSVASH